MIWEVTQTFDAATNLFTVTTREFEEGSLRITEQKTLTKEELEAQETVSSKQENRSKEKAVGYIPPPFVSPQQSFG